MLQRLIGLLIGCALILAAVAASVPNAYASSDCDLAVRPAATFSVSDPAGTFMVTLLVDQIDLSAIEASRSLARFTTAAYSANSKAAIEAYFDSVVAWNRALAAPCAAALPYEGPYTNRPVIGDSAYGFGGIDVTAASPIVMVVTDPEGEEVEVAPVSQDGPALANSGSESYVLAYFGAGLLAFGASALGMRRWMAGPLEDRVA